MRSRQVAKQKPKTKKHPGAHSAAGCWPPGSVYSTRPQRGFGVLVGLLGGILVAEFGACRQENGCGVKAGTNRRGSSSSNQAAIIAPESPAPTLSGERECSSSTIVSRLQTMPMTAMTIASAVVQSGPSSGLAVNKAKEL